MQNIKLLSLSDSLNNYKFKYFYTNITYYYTNTPTNSNGAGIVTNGG